MLLSEHVAWRFCRGLGKGFTPRLEYLRTSGRPQRRELRLARRICSSDVYIFLLSYRLCRWYSRSRGPMRCCRRLEADFPPVATVPVAFLSFCGGGIEIVGAAVGVRIESARRAPGGHGGHVVWASASPIVASHPAGMERRGARSSHAVVLFTAS
jgi:hypothetical protein